MSNIRIELFDGSHNPLLDHTVRPVPGLETTLYLPAFDNRNAALPAYMVISCPIPMPDVPPGITEDTMSDFTRIEWEGTRDH